jgi:hypothetical protein
MSFNKTESSTAIPTRKAAQNVSERAAGSSIRSAGNGQGHEQPGHHESGGANRYRRDLPQRGRACGGVASGDGGVSAAAGDGRAVGVLS